MQKIYIKVSKEALIFTYHHADHQIPRELINTNIISRDELVFSLEYLKTNARIVSLFLCDLLKENNLKKCIIDTYALAKDIIDIINRTPLIKELYFAEEKALPFGLCEKLIENKNLTYINCFSIPPFMIELLDKSKFEVLTRSEILFTGKFMEINNLDQYSKMFYKTNIRIESILNSQDESDFIAFCKINRYLKTIHLYHYTNESLDHLIKLLRDNRIKHINIKIHKNITTPEEADYLKKAHKKFKKKYKHSISIVYSKDYLHENLSTHLILSVLKACCLALGVIVITVFGTLFTNNLIAEKKDNDILNAINAAIENQKNITPIEPQPINPPDPTNPEVPPVQTQPPIPNTYKALLEINEETVGWIKINNTKVDYPVVKAADNDFYLTRNIYKKNDYNGWIFMDYRNTTDEINRNTIIYGHNMYYSGVMFGTLGKTTKKDWYTNPENTTISFNTIHSEMEWEIFSIYRINVTNDYIQTDFKSNKEFLTFLNLLKSRSIHDFGILVDSDTKILTLSTCTDNNKRLVIHAALKKS